MLAIQRERRTNEREAEKLGDATDKPVKGLRVSNPRQTRRAEAHFEAREGAVIEKKKGRGRLILTDLHWPPVADTSLGECG